MLILLVRHEEEKLRELRSFTETRYPGSEIAAFTDGATSGRVKRPLTCASRRWRCPARPTLT